ncbi:hypothetical protein ACOMHN_045241 [Nucella lapillus]
MTRFTRSRSLGGRQTPKTSKEEDGDQQASGQSTCQKKNQSKRQSSQTVAPNGGHKQETESTESQTAVSEFKVKSGSSKVVISHTDHNTSLQSLVSKDCCLMVSFVVGHME